MTPDASLLTKIPPDPSSIMVIQSTAPTSLQTLWKLSQQHCLSTRRRHPSPTNTDTSSTQDLIESVPFRGVAFNVDAIKSTYKVTTIGSNVYTVWFKDVEDIAPMDIEEVTKGWSVALFFYSLSIH